MDILNTNYENLLLKTAYQKEQEEQVVTEKAEENLFISANDEGADGISLDSVNFSTNSASASAPATIAPPVDYDQNDINEDGKVDYKDVLALIGKGDTNGDGTIDNRETANYNSELTRVVNAVLKGIKGNKTPSIKDYMDLILTSRDAISTIANTQPGAEAIKKFITDAEDAMKEKLKNNSNIFDLNNDKKTNIEDFEAFMELTKDRNVSDASKAFLKSLESKLATKTLDYSGSDKKLDQNDLAALEYKMQEAIKYFNKQSGNAGILTEKELIAKFDANGDGKFSQEDINAMKTGTEYLYSQTVKDYNKDGKIDNSDISLLTSVLDKAKATQIAADADYKTKNKTYTDAIAAAKAAKAEDDKKGTTLTNAKNATNSAKAAMDAAKKAWDRNPNSTKLKKDFDTAQEKYINAVKAQADAESKKAITAAALTVANTARDTAKIANDAAKTVLDSANTAVAQAQKDNKSIATYLNKVSALQKNDTKAAQTAINNAQKTLDTKKVEEATAKTAYETALADYNTKNNALIALQTSKEEATVENTALKLALTTAQSEEAATNAKYQTAFEAFSANPTDPALYAALNALEEEKTAAVNKRVAAESAVKTSNTNIATINTNITTASNAKTTAETKKNNKETAYNTAKANTATALAELERLTAKPEPEKPVTDEPSAPEIPSGPEVPEDPEELEE